MASNIENVRESLASKKIIGLVIPDAEYDEMLIEVAKGLSKDYTNILYISINKSCESLNSKFKQSEMDRNKFYFIDCISRTSNDVMPDKNCIYVSSPKALDEIQTAILDIFREKKIDLVLIDSPSSLLTYYERTDVLQFIHRLMAILIIANCRGIFPFQKEGADSLRRSIEMFTNKIVNLESGE